MDYLRFNALGWRLVAFVWLVSAIAGATETLTDEERAWLQEPRQHNFSVIEDVRIELGKIDELTLEELFKLTEEDLDEIVDWARTVETDDKTLRTFAQSVRATGKTNECRNWNGSGCDSS